MPESLQHKLDRVRRPRVHITYDVEVGGAMKKVELPFVVGVLADLSGQSKQPLPTLRDRKAIAIDRDNFNDVLARSGARLALRVPNMLSDPNSKLAVELNFNHIDDFEPARVAEQIGPLKELLDMRRELVQLLSRLEGNDQLEKLLADILTNQEKAQALGQLIDSQAASASAVAPPPPSAKKAPVAAPPAAVAAKPSAPPPPVAAKPPAPVKAAAPSTEPPASEAPTPPETVDPDLDDLLKQLDAGS
jgi:type VI secretion system protein ImpB